MAKSLQKRIAGWKDITLVNRLRKFGFEPYSPEYRKRIRGGKYHIPTKRRKELEKQYQRLIEEAAPVEGWMTLGDWLDSIQTELKGFQATDSYFRLHNFAGINFVYTKGNRVAFANANTVTPPMQTKVDPPEPQYVIYSIHVITETMDEIDTDASYHSIDHTTWFQATEAFYFGPNPFGVNETKRAKAYIEKFKENILSEKQKVQKSQFSYGFMQDAKDVKVKFLGIGLVL